MRIFNGLFGGGKNTTTQKKTSSNRSSTVAGGVVVPNTNRFDTHRIPGPKELRIVPPSDYEGVVFQVTYVSETSLFVCF